MIRLSQAGVVADATDSAVLAGTATDNAEAMREAVRRAVRLSKPIVHDVPGWAMLSETVDLRGVSVFGLGGRVTGFRVDPRTSPEDWLIGDHRNDLMMLGSRGKDGWTIYGVGFHGSDAYAQPLTAWGGKGIVFSNIYATKVGKCGLQMMGSRNPGDVPIENALIVGCEVEKSKWNIGIDGQAVNVKITGNRLYDAVVRHISCDGREAMEPSIETQRVTIRGNRMDGCRAAPTEWWEHPTKPRPGCAILASHGRYAIHTDNVLTGWPVGREWLVSRNAHLKVLNEAPDTFDGHKLVL